MSKIKYILLIDDDKINNFVCSRIIQLSGITERVECVLAAREGMEILKSNISSAENLPDVIFLDINMPGMNGWDFLEEYKKIKSQFPKKIHIFMLSSSLYKEDIEKSRMYEEVYDYLTKPLTMDHLREVEQKYFS